MTPERPAATFALTRWTLVQRARGRTPEARVALAELCEGYYEPVFRFLRCEGREEDAARELTQEFFARVLGGGGFAGAEAGRGRFRSFLLGSVKHFLGDLRDRERRLKRGGGMVPLSLDAPPTAAGHTAAGLQVPDHARLPSDAWFDRHWALTIVARAMGTLEGEFRAAGKKDQFHALKPWLEGESVPLSQAEAVRQLGLSEGAVKVAIHRLRARFRELVRAEVSQTIAEGDDLGDELRYLVEVLAKTTE